ncbi:MAG: hypothetical protein L6R41_000372 [Letrouitia leprolyta]|nr:MAG: hypothetical protein L6R41_000372 [Letrouitia leprolyta]
MDVKDDHRSKVDTYIVNDDGDHHAMDELDPTGVIVKPKWRGNSMDKMDMEALGRNQVLRGTNRRRTIPLGLRICAPKTSKIPELHRWQAGLLSVGFIVGTIIQGLIVLNNPSYVFERWHGTFLVWAITAFCVIFNTVLAKRLPAVEGIVLTIHVMGLFAVIVPLWILAPRATANEALLTYTNGGGWPTTGLSSMIGLLTPMGSLLGFDCAVHMSEEVEDASRTLPRSIMWSVYLNGAMGLIMAITMCYCLGDLQEVVKTDTGYPFIQVFFNVTKSYAATNIMTTIIIITLTACCISEVATSSRQLWSFARDKGIPFSDWFAYVSPTMHIPLRAVLVSMSITCVISLINIGSTAALNAIVSLCVVSLLSSYYITIACLVWRRLRGEPLPPRRWSLGRYGLAINIISLLFLTPIWFFAFWPLSTPVEPSTMNWAVVMYGGVIIWSLVYYAVWGKESYVGPVSIVKRDL